MASRLKDDITRAKRIVFHLLKYRSRSRKEIQDRLRQKKFPADTINQVIDYFDRLNLLDDQAFAASWLSSRLGKPLGLRRIFFELKQKGISDEIIQEAQDKVRDNYNEYEVVSELAKEKIKKLKGLDYDKAKSRVYNFLIRRGFTIDVINEVINEL